MTPIEKAKMFATIMHEDQVRKYTNDPYIIHPTAVATLVELFCAPFFPSVTAENMICSAWLHDTIEDCAVNRATIRAHWGMKVSAMVDGLTDRANERANREARKKVDREHMIKQSAETQMIKCADLIDNTRSIAVHDTDFARVYLKEKVLLLDAMKPSVQTSMIGRIARSTVDWGVAYVKN